MNFHNKSVLITGGSRGLGKALALELFGRGAKVVIVARNKDELEGVVDEIRSGGGQALSISADVSLLEAVHAIVGRASAFAGPVDILINNASTLGSTPLPLLSDTDTAGFQEVLNTNLLGPFRLTQAVLGNMLLRNEGLILNISSDASVSAYPRWGAYSVSKAALDHLTRIWAAEVEDFGVRFLSVDPGEMDTKMHASAIPDADLSTLAHPAHVASKIVTLIERSSDYENGARLSLESLKEEVPA